MTEQNYLLYFGSRFLWSTYEGHVCGMVLEPPQAFKSLIDGDIRLLKQGEFDKESNNWTGDKKFAKHFIVGISTWYSC